jgi:hypothetical protein
MARNWCYLGKYQIMYRDHHTIDVPEPELGWKSSTPSSEGGRRSAVVR